MVESGQELHFRLDPALTVDCFMGLGGKKLQRNITAKLFIARTVNHSCGALPDQGNNPVSSSNQRYR
ncbi:hypothetical protein GCM10027405_11220 [Arthrobacter alkaliphilus]